jgi:hypothetical protein
LFGVAGVGKTTLARTVTASLGSQVRWVACTESSRGIPLGAMAHLVGVSTSRDPITLMAAARESLIGHGDTVISVDDAQLLDELSATLLHQIAVDRAGYIMAMVRSGEPVPDAITSLWKDGYLRRFELSPFTKQQSIALVESVLGGTLEGLSADVMWESSGGNPNAAVVCGKLSCCRAPCCGKDIRRRPTRSSLGLRPRTSTSSSSSSGAFPAFRSCSGRWGMPQALIRCWRCCADVCNTQA